MTKTYTRRPQADVIAAIRTAFKGHDIWNNKRVKGRTLKIAVLGACQGDKLRMLSKILNRYGWPDVKPVFKKNVTNERWASQFCNSDSILIHFPLEDKEAVVAADSVKPSKAPRQKASQPKQQFPMTKDEVDMVCKVLDALLIATRVKALNFSQPGKVPAWNIRCYGKSIFVETLNTMGLVLQTKRYTTVGDLRKAAGLVPKGVWPNVR